jgi:CspA family cold shock protein
MPSGRVKFFNTDRGYGFIAPDGGGPDVFVHVHDVEAAGMLSRTVGPLTSDPRDGGIDDRCVVRMVDMNVRKRPGRSLPE